MRRRIAAALDAAERDEGVRVLLAVESGSRAWGFPSRDSDWDVRCPEVDAFVAAALAPGAARPAAWDRSHSLAAADALLLRATGGM
jgi:hypothetical protein